MADIPGWEESQPYTDYGTEANLSSGVIDWYPVLFDVLPSGKHTVSQIRFRIGSAGSGSVKAALYAGTSTQPTGAPLFECAEQAVTPNSYIDFTISPAVTVTTNTCWIAIRWNGSGTAPRAIYTASSPGGNENRARTRTGVTYASAWPSPPGSSPSSFYGYAAVYLDEVIANITDATGHGTDTPSITVSLSRSDTGGGSDSVGAPDGGVSVSDTGSGSDAASLISQLVSIVEAGAGADVVSVTVDVITLADAGEGLDSALSSTGYLISDLGFGADSVVVRVALALADTINSAESFAAPLIVVYDSGGVSTVPGREGEIVVAPLIVVSDSGAGTDSILRLIAIPDTAAGAEEIAITASLSVADTGRGLDYISITGPELPEPGAPETGNLEAKHVLKLILGDKRDPTRELDLAQSGDGNIFLRTTGHKLGAGDPKVLWSGTSYRFDGQKKVAESRDNTELALSYDLAAGSAAGVSAAQRQINRFFLDAKRYEEDGDGLPVHLVYRWSDNLGSLPAPWFGQLNYYWRVYHANVPQWPENIHDGRIVTGNIEEVVCRLAASPYPEGVRQLAPFGAGDITEDTHGTRVNRSADTSLVFSQNTTEKFAGQFTIEGWFTVYWDSPADDRPIFEMYLPDGQSVKLVYEGANSYFRVTRVVGGATRTATSNVATYSNEEHVHFAVVQDATTLRLYLNGVEAASVTAALWGSYGAGIHQFYLASSISDTQGSAIALDGWRIFDAGLTATQVAQLYATELVVKGMDETVGAVPYCLGHVAYAVDDSGGDNFFIVGGVSGDVEALAEYYVGIDGGWLGRRAYRSKQATRLNWVDIGGTSDPDSSGGSFGGFPLSGNQTYDLISLDNPDPELLNGRYIALARAKNISGTVTLRACFTYSGAAEGLSYKSGGRSLPVSADFALYDLGEIFINLPDPDFDPARGLFFAEFESDGAYNVQVDFILLLPWPWQYLERTGGGELSANAVFCDRPHLYDSLGLGHQAESQGDPVTLVPKHYNYVWCVPWTDEETASSVFVSSQMLYLYITPRFLLPGGLIG
jgi:hypothetical protein